MIPDNIYVVNVSYVTRLHGTVTVQAENPEVAAKTVEDLLKAEGGNDIEVTEINKIDEGQQGDVTVH